MSDHHSIDISSSDDESKKINNSSCNSNNYIAKRYNNEDDRELKGGKSGDDACSECIVNCIFYLFCRIFYLLYKCLNSICGGKLSGCSCCGCICACWMNKICDLAGYEELTPEQAGEYNFDKHTVYGIVLHDTDKLYKCQSQPEYTFTRGEYVVIDRITPYNEIYHTVFRLKSNGLSFASSYKINKKVVKILPPVKSIIREAQGKFVDVWTDSMDKEIREKYLLKPDEYYCIGVASFQNLAKAGRSIGCIKPGDIIKLTSGIRGNEGINLSMDPNQPLRQGSFTKESVYYPKVVIL